MLTDLTLTHHHSGRAGRESVRPGPSPVSTPGQREIALPDPVNQKPKAESQPASSDNFRIIDDHLGEGGPKAQYAMNVAAINALRQIEAEGRCAIPEEQICQRETLDEILAVLALCTDTQRERFLLYALYDFSYAEIAKMEDCTKAAVHYSIETVRKKFLQFFKKLT